MKKQVNVDEWVSLLHGQGLPTAGADLPFPGGGPDAERNPGRAVVGRQTGGEAGGAADARNGGEHSELEKPAAAFGGDAEPDCFGETSASGQCKAVG